MKIKMTKKNIAALSNDIICIGYCGAQYLLRGTEPNAYTSGVYGWNFDAYFINGLTICTGYRGTPGRAPKVSVEKYEKKAKAIWCDFSLTYEQQKKKVEKLLEKFCKEA